MKSMKYRHLGHLLKEGLIDFTAKGTWEIRPEAIDASDAEERLAQRNAEVEEERKNPENEYLEKKARVEAFKEVLARDEDLPQGVRAWFGGPRTAVSIRREEGDPKGNKR